MLGLVDALGERLADGETELLGEMLAEGDKEADILDEGEYD